MDQQSVLRDGEPVRAGVAEGRDRWRRGGLPGEGGRHPAPAHRPGAAAAAARRAGDPADSAG